MKVTIEKLAAAGSEGVRRVFQLEPGQEISIGRSADIIVDGKGVRRRHAVLVVENGELVVRGFEKRRVDMGGAQAAVVERGASFFVGVNRFHRLESGPVDEAHLQIVDESAHAHDDIREQIRIGGIRERFKGAWDLFFGFGGLSALMLAVPLAAVATVGLLKDLPFTGTGPRRFAAVGTMSPAHANLANACELCHTESFRPVGNDACLSCHASVGMHGRIEHNARANDRCGSCHAEHRGAAGLLSEVSFDDTCVDCHREAQPEVDLLKVTAFATDHPMRVTLLSESRVDRRPIADRPTEPSMLRFSHEGHLAAGLPAKVPGRGARGTCANRPLPDPLECGHCHVPTADGRRMQPITFRDHCECCHDLTIPGIASGYAVSHGRAPLETFEEIKAIDAAVAMGAQRRDGPGATTPPEAAEYFLGEEGLCGSCHVTSGFDPATPERPVSIMRDVKPVRMRPFRTTIEDRVEWTSWQPRARFDHGAHREVACVDCHAAAASTSADDILMPNITICRDCHGKTINGFPVHDACTTCHDYHLDRYRRLEPSNKLANAATNAGTRAGSR